MQDFMYSIISCVAIAIHLIINSGMLTGRRLVTVYGKRYSAFLKALLAYYAVDAAWGILAGLGWTRLLHADTVLYFIVLPLTPLFTGILLKPLTYAKLVDAFASPAAKQPQP